MPRSIRSLALALAALALPAVAGAQVLGSCGTDQADTPGAAVAVAPASATAPMQPTSSSWVRTT